MSPSTAPLTSDRSGDPLWSLLVGLYLGLLGTPPLVFSVARLVATDAAVLYGAAIASATALTSLGWWATAHWKGTAVRLGASRARWLTAAIPVAYALGGFASLSATGAVGALAVFGGLGAMAVGFALGVMARTRYTDEQLNGVDIGCEFRAGWPAAGRRRLGFVAAAVVAAAMASFLVGVFSDRVLLQTAGQLLLPLGLVAYTSTDARDYTLSPAGLEQRLPVARQLTPWDAFDGYTCTDDALVLHRQWRIDTRFALADLDDPDAVEAAIETHLGPR